MIALTWWDRPGQSAPTPGGRGDGGGGGRRVRVGETTDVQTGLCWVMMVKRNPSICTVPYRSHNLTPMKGDHATVFTDKSDIRRFRRIKGGEKKNSFLPKM